MCIATDDAGNVLTTENAGAPKPVWRLANLESGDLTDISCPSRQFCAALDAGGDVFWSRRPFAGLRYWHESAVGQPVGGEICADCRAISCPSASFCVAIGAGYGYAPGTLYTTGDPTGGPGSWQSAPVDETPYDCFTHDYVFQCLYSGLTDVSCASPSLCVVVYDRANGSVSTDPAGGSGAWTGVDVEGLQLGPLSSVDCPSVSLCLATDNTGQILSTSDPTSTEPWASALVDPRAEMDSVSCPSASFCVAVDSLGRAAVSTQPTSPFAWKLTDLGTRTSLTDVSCSSPSLCVAVDRIGRVVVGQVPHPPAKRHKKHKRRHRRRR
jgi:hypothetical protein